MKLSELKSHDAIVRERRESDPEYAAEEHRLAQEDDNHCAFLREPLEGE
ncbi:hypothetical protein GCM10027591_04900 [Zhihengliuella somnathii]